MNREMKDNLHQYCKDRNRRKSRYDNRIRDKQKSEYRGEKFSSKAHNKIHKLKIEEW